MKCLVCGRGSVTARYCKACKAFNCDVCRPNCSVDHRPFHMKLIKVNATVKWKKKASPSEDYNSDGASSEEEQPEPVIFVETPP